MASNHDSAPGPWPPQRKTDRRIAIIGAGAAGLSAAHYLWRKGYRRITVFDRRPRVGGKCLTRTIAGRNYELGALVVGNPYPRVREMIAAAGLEVMALDAIRTVDTRQPRAIAWAEEAYDRSPHAAKVRLLAAYLRHYRRLSRPGFRGLEKTDLAGATMAAWLRQRDLTNLRAVLAPYYVSWGYGYLERVSAAYVFKLLDLYYRALAVNYLKPHHVCRMGFIPQGYQRLWERIAEPFELCLGVDIREVRRDRRVTIAHDDQKREFEALIMACPIPNTLPFLDVHPRERALIAKIRTLDFFTITAAVDGLPDNHLFFVRNHLTSAHAGHMVSWYRRWPECNIFVFYIIGASGQSMDELVGQLIRDLAGIGAALRVIHDSAHWHYFPHVSASNLREGFYRDFENLQGHRRTWYAGELLAFPTVEHVVAYSQRLVDRHF
jgi:protoporphyrinogen oxidase